MALKAYTSPSPGPIQSSLVGRIFLSASFFPPLPLTAGLSVNPSTCQFDVASTVVPAARLEMAVHAMGGSNGGRR